MAALKNQVNELSKDTESLAKDYVKLFSYRQSQKLAMFLGILFSVFLLATLLLIVVVFTSFVFAGYLNKVLPGEYWGFAIVGGLYLLTIILLIVKIFKTKSPVLGNFFARLVITIFDIDTGGSNTLEGLKHAGEKAQQRIDANQKSLKAQLQMLRYTIFEAFFKEIIGFFKPRRKEKKEKKKSQNA